MNAAIYIKSESSDSYVYLFIDKTVEEIDYELRQNLEFISPICEFIIDVQDNNTRENETILKKCLQKLQKDSYEFL